MDIRFSTEMKIESKNCNIPISNYSKIEKKKFNTNALLFLFVLFKLREGIPEKRDPGPYEDLGS